MLRESKIWPHKRSKAKTKKLSEGPYWPKLAQKRPYLFTTTYETVSYFSRIDFQTLIKLSPQI